MYNNKLAVCVKAAGKVLRELKDQVYLPFGSEYSVFIKNLDTVRVLAKVEIDGQDVGDGTKFIVPANGTIDIERFLKNGNLEQGNRFKFIERTAGVEKARGVGAEDGLIRVEFQFEKRMPKYDWPNDRCGMPRPWETWPPYVPYKYYYWNDTFGGSLSNSTLTTTSLRSAIPMNASGGTSSSLGGSVTTQAFVADSSPVASSFCATPTLNDAGITVPGSISDQKFQTGAWFPVESETHVIVLKLLGEAKGKKVEQAVTVKQKPKCTTCGRVNKATAKFCVDCGTSLQIV